MSRPIVTAAYISLHAFALYFGFDLFVAVIAAAFVLGLAVQRWWVAVVPLVPLLAAPAVLVLTPDNSYGEVTDLGVFLLALGLSLSAGFAAALGFGAAYALRPRAS
jgi:hypothetical protein